MQVNVYLLYNNIITMLLVWCILSMILLAYTCHGNVPRELPVNHICRYASVTLHELNFHFRNTNKSLVSNSIYTERHKNIIRSYLNQRDTKYNIKKNDPARQGCIYHQLTQHFKQEALIIYDSSTMNMSKEIQACSPAFTYHEQRLVEVVNESFLYDKMYPWKATNVKILVILSSIETTIRIINIAKTLKLLSREFVWIVIYSELIYREVEIPENVFTLKCINEPFRRIYQVETNNNLKNERTCEILYLDCKAKWHKFGEATSKQIKLNSHVASLRSYAASMAKPVVNLKVVTIIDPPFTYLYPSALYDTSCYAGKLCWHNEWKNNTKKLISYCCIGFYIDLLKHIENGLGRTADVYIAEDASYGEYVNGTWIGMVGAIVNGKADIASLLSIGEERSKVIDFTEPYIAADLVIALNVHTKHISFPNTRTFSSLSGLLWITVFLIIFASSLVLFLSEKIVRQQIEWRYTWLESITYLIGLLFQRDIGGMNPYNMGSRILSISLAIATMIVMSTYTAVLTANTVHYTKELAITGIKDPKITNPSNAFTYGTVAKSFNTQLFRDSIDPNWNKMHIFMESYNYQRIEDGFKLLKEGTLNGIIVTREMGIYHIAQQKDCIIKFAKEHIQTSGIAMAVQKGDILSFTLSNLILNYKKDGTMKILHQKWLRSGCYEAKDLHEATRLESVHFGGLFILTSACIGVAGLVFVIEHMINIFLMSRRSSNLIPRK